MIRKRYFTLLTMFVCCVIFVGCGAKEGSTLPQDLGTSAESSQSGDGLVQGGETAQAAESENDTEAEPNEDKDLDTIKNELVQEITLAMTKQEEIYTTFDKRMADQNGKDRLSSDELELWDTVLRDTCSYITEYLSEDELPAFTAEQAEWLDHREDEAYFYDWYYEDEEYGEEDDFMVSNRSKARITRERVRDLIERYVDEKILEPKDGELSHFELEAIEDKLNGIGCYGFLLNYYDDPRYIEWLQVFYNGAGFDQGYPSEEMLQACKAHGYDDFFTDIVTVSAEDVENYVKLTTGYDYSEMYMPLVTFYLEEYDMYILQHGDTNRTKVKAVSGNLADGIYSIVYGESDCVKFAANADGTLRFVSNLPEQPSSEHINKPRFIFEEEGFVFNDSDLRKLKEDELKGLSAEELRTARNEIYARCGRKFSDKAIQEYFDKLDWYYPSIEPEYFDESMLNIVEKYNVNLISKYEESANKR